MPFYSSVTPAAARTLACDCLRSAADWKPYRRSMPVAPMLRMLVLMGALGRSLSAVAKSFRLGVSHETARKAVRACLPPESADLAASLSRALAGLARPDLARRKRGWRVAIDLHNAPFYGGRSKPGVVGGPKKAGTKFSFCYATACVVERRRRYTLALVPVLASEKPHATLARVLAALRRSGARLAGVALDSGFDSGGVYRLLQAEGLPYVVPLRRKGRGDNARNRWFAMPPGTVGEAAWRTEEGDLPVKTRVAVWLRPGRERADVFAFGGWPASDARRASAAARRYRERFGIETSYRQMNRCKPPTSSCDPCYRLLLIGVALILRQCWVWLTARLAADRDGRVLGWTLDRQLDWLGRAVRAIHPEARPPALDVPISLP